MTPIEFGVSRSKVKVTVTFKLGGVYIFHKHFLFSGLIKDEVGILIVQAVTQDD